MAGRLGIKIAYGAQSPEQKVEIVRGETATGRTIFVGDGINDAPAMLAASVGVAFGPNSDVTAEAADARNRVLKFSVADLVAISDQHAVSK